MKINVIIKRMININKRNKKIYKMKLIMNK